MLRSFVFLELPGEIRNQIYQQLLIVPPLSQPSLLGDPPVHASILRTCQRVHEEARQLLYGFNTFLAHPNILTGLPRLRLYYDTISDHSLIALIRRYHIRVRLDCDPNFSALQARDAFTGVEELTIEVCQAQFGSCDYKVLQLFEAVRNVSRARIYGSVIAFPGYVQWLEQSMVTPKGQAVRTFDEDKVSMGTIKEFDSWTSGQTWEDNDLHMASTSS